MNKKKNKIIAIGLGYVNIGLHTLLSFVLTPVMIVIWGDASYGVYKIILSLMAYFLLVDSGIRNTVNRFVSEYRVSADWENERRYIAVVSLFYLIASSVLCVIVGVFHRFVPSIYRMSLTGEEIGVIQDSLPWLTLYTIATLYFNCFSALIRSHNLQIVAQTINIARALMRFCVLYVLLKQGITVTDAVMVDALMSAVFAGIEFAYVFLIMRLPPKLDGITADFMKRIINFSGAMLVLTVAETLFWSVGNFLVGVMTSGVIAAVYTTAITLTNMFQSLVSPVSQVLAPDIMVKSMKSRNMDEINKLMICTGRIKGFVLIPIVLGFALFGREFISVWIGEQYYGTYLVALLLMIVLTLGLLQDVPNQYVLAHNQHKIIARAAVISSIVNVIISVSLIGVLSFYGAMLGTMCAYFSTHIVYKYWFYSRKFGFNMSRLYFEVIISNIGWMLVLAVSGLIINRIPFQLWFEHGKLCGWISLFAKIIAFSAVYIAVLFFGMMSREERETIVCRCKR